VIITNFVSETNSAVKDATDLRVNIPYVTVQNDYIHLINKCYGNPEVSMMAQILQPTTINFPIVQDTTTVIDQPIHSNTFFYQPPNDLCSYYIKYKKISVKSLNEFSSNISNINDYVFFHQQQSNNQIYQIICEIVSPSFIINHLNKNIYGIEIEQNIGHEQFDFQF